MSARHDTDGRDLMVFQAYNVETGHPRLRISTIAWVDDWPKVALATTPAD